MYVYTRDTITHQHDECLHFSQTDTQLLLFLLLIITTGTGTFLFILSCPVSWAPREGRKHT